MAEPLTDAIVRVARLQRMLAQQLLRGVGLHLGQELVMMRLWEHGPQTQTELVRALDSDSATMTRTVRRLEEAGFVRRHPSPTDRRATIIEPTPAGHGVRREVERIWARLETSAVGTLTPAQQAEAIDVLRLLEANLRESGPPTIT
ncbi:MarR family winged helix-turn-helix transcriptional regulator [Kribbella sp. NPDC059898]|uniref:MarR family winged helix-turn-helix transcriptional regulator n=1 Tax=Kribbella sp. NPDC059898 TaxID=3346995 RepID=UPI00365C1B8D